MKTHFYKTCLKRMRLMIILLNDADLTWGSAEALEEPPGPHWPRSLRWAGPQRCREWWRTTAASSSPPPEDRSESPRRCLHIWQWGDRERWWDGEGRKNTAREHTKNIWQYIKVIYSFDTSCQCIYKGLYKYYHYYHSVENNPVLYLTSTQLQLSVHFMCRFLHNNSNYLTAHLQSSPYFSSFLFTRLSLVSFVFFLYLHFIFLSVFTFQLCLSACCCNKFHQLGVNKVFLSPFPVTINPK